MSEYFDIRFDTNRRISILFYSVQFSTDLAGDLLLCVFEGTIFRFSKKVIGTKRTRARNSGCSIDRSRRNPAHASSFVLADPLICSEQSMQLQLLAANYTRDLIYYERKIIHNSRLKLLLRFELSSLSNGS